MPLAAISLLVLARTIFRGVRWSKWSFISALVVLALDGFALYLALGHHHLIDWLEGH